MKRLLLSAVLATGLHFLLLGVNPDWLKGPVRRPIRQPVTMTLLPRQVAPKPPKAAPKPPIQPPKAAPKQPKPIAKPVKPPAPKPLRLPPPPKTVAPAVIPPPPKIPTPSPTVPQPSVPQAPAIPSPPAPPAATTEILPAPPTAPAPIQADQPRPVEAAVSSQEQTLREAIPLYRSNPPPKYPRTARRRGFQGTVLLEVLVGPQGNVLDAKIVHSSGYPILDKSALQIVPDWLFEPGYRGILPIEMWVRVPIEFKLK